MDSVCESAVAEPGGAELPVERGDLVAELLVVGGEDARHAHCPVIVVP